MTPPLPPGIDLDQYRTRAKELLRQLRDAQPDAGERLRAHHPEHETLAAKPAAVRLPVPAHGPIIRALIAAGADLDASPGLRADVTQVLWRGFSTHA